MPVDSVELLKKLKNKVLDRNAVSCTNSVRNWLNSSLSIGYQLVEEAVRRAYFAECDKTSANKYHVLQAIKSENAHALNLFDQETASRKAQLESDLNIQYGAPPVRDYWAWNTPVDSYAALREPRRQALERDRSTQRSLLVRAQEAAYLSSEREETEKETQILAALKNGYQTVQRRLANEQPRILEQIVNDAFIKKHVQDGLNDISDAVFYFVNQHLWAATDNSLALDIYAVERNTAPWRYWYDTVKEVMGSVGSRTWGTVSYSSFADYVTWAAKEMPLEEQVNAFDQRCQQSIPVLSLSDQVMTPNLRNYLYAPSQLSALYVNQQRQGIKNFAYTEDERDKHSIDLCFRRVDWLRVIEAALPWSVRYASIAQRMTMSPVLALSLAEVCSYLSNNDVQVVVLNVGTEQEPIWTLMRRTMNMQWNIFVPDSINNVSVNDLSALIKERVSDELRVTTTLNFVAVNIDKHDTEQQRQEGGLKEVDSIAEDITGQLWTAVLAARVLPFCLECNTVKGCALDSYRHQLPLSVLMESALGSAVIRESFTFSYLAPYKYRQEISKRYAQRAFWNNPGTLEQAWSFGSSQLHDIKTCLRVDGADFSNVQQFLAAIDAGAMTLQTKTDAAPTWFLSPTKSISGLKPGDYQRTALTQSDFYYAMTVVYQQGIERFDIDNPMHASWTAQWTDCAHEFTVSSWNGLLPAANSYSKGMRNLVDSYAFLMTVAPVSPNLPAVLKYTASCAARNRLMKEHFSQRAIASPTAMDALWEETEQYVLSLLTRAAAMETPQDMESFCDQLSLFIGAQGNSGWIQAHCVDQPTPEDGQQKFIWEFAQIAQMGIRGLEVIFKQWHRLTEPLSSLTFDLNGQTTTADEYIDRLNSYATAYSRHNLPRLNLVMPIQVANLKLAQSMASLMIELSRRSGKQVNKAENGIYLYNMAHQPVADRIAFLALLLNEVQSKAITTMITIPQYDLNAAVANAQECKAHDLYRQIQNTILNNQRLTRAALVKTNTAQLQNFVRQGLLPNVKEVRDVQDDVVMLPSETEEEYIVSGGAHGIQQQLQQAQQQQKQVAQQQHVELAKKVDVEEELQIVVYRSKGEELWTKETIDQHGRKYWDQLPETTRSLSGFDDAKETPLKELFSAWVGSEHAAAYVVTYMEPEAAEKIMKFAPVFRYGLYHDNLPPGFFLAKKENDLVLCFDRIKEQDEMNTIAYAALHGGLTARQARKIILEAPMQAEAMPGGDDRQFDMMPAGVNAEQVKPGYWRHLVTVRAAREEYVDAARAALNERADAATDLLDARVQASLQVSAFQGNRKPLASAQVETVRHLQQWASSFVTRASFIEHLFLHDRKQELLDEEQIKKQLRAFGQLTHIYDSLPVKQDQQGSCQFMRLVGEFERTFSNNDEYLYIWRDRLLTPLNNWSTCLDKREIDAMVQSLRVLQDKPVHAEFWWRLVDRHGATVGPVLYAPLWASCYQLMQYIDEQDLILSPVVIEQWNKLLQSDAINGQILLERMQSVLRRVARSAVDASDAKKYQQEILNHVNEIDWNHDGLFYASRYDGLSGFWDADLVEHHFDFSVADKKSYFPSFDSFQLMDDASVDEGIRQEFVSVLRYLTRHFSNDAAHYWQVTKPFFNQYWFNNDTIKALDSSARIAVLRLLMKSFVLGQNRIENFKPDALAQLIVLAQDEVTQNSLQQLSRLGSLDNAGLRDIVWPVHFENLPLLINLFATKAGQELLARKQLSIQLLRHAELALNCFNSECFKVMAKEQGVLVDGLLAQWLAKQQDYPYLVTYPWLILSIVKQPVDFQTHHDALMVVHQQGGAEYTRLTKQMHSIDFNHSTALPSLTDLSARLPLEGWWNKSLSADTRNSFIDHASAQGCCIIDQGQGFRLPTEEEKSFIDAEFQRRMGKSAYFSMNKALFHQAMQHLALPEQQTAETHKLFARFIDVLALIHNKNYYNELGQVLGVILHGVATDSPHPGHYYSLPQLHEWINSLATANIGHTDKHYPVHLLKELVHAPGDQKLISPGLLKPLNRLQECQSASPNTTVRRDWLRLCHSALPNQYSALIARLMVHSAALSQLAIDVKAFFEKPRQSPRFLEALYGLLQQPTVLDGRFPNASVTDWFFHLRQPTASGIDPQMYQYALLQLTAYLETQATPKRDLAGAVDPDWVIPLESMERVWSQIRYETSYWGGPKNQALAQKKLLILAYATQGKFKLPSNIGALWQKMDEGALQVIIDYYQSGAQLSLVELMHLLSLSPIAIADSSSEDEALETPSDESPEPSDESDTDVEEEEVIACYTEQQMCQRLHHYETVVQGTKPDGTPKRIYSAPDTEELLRVISGFEQKGVGPSSDVEQQQLINLFYYMNEYSQLTELDAMSFSELQDLLHNAKNELVTYRNPNAPETQQVSARLLACMREIYLRRSGKWANHTQMLTLLYSACHNDESLLYQVRTGQGKSILTLMRASYLALTGKEVDVFSAKESLSSRDFLEAKAVFDAMDIPCGYITPNSEASEYKQRTSHWNATQVKGAINFATLGNFSLFLSRNAWMDPVKITPDPKYCVAFLDEADHILLDDQTQFNFPDPGAEREAYNFDEWAYRIIYQYYRDEILGDAAFLESKKISRQQHLDKLSQKLIELRTMAPEDSKFFGAHLLPAMTAKGAARSDALAKRDKALVYLIKAAHAAYHLKEGVDFCSSEDQRMLLGQVVPVRILQVMISNQVQEGATYSDGVHQMLCVRKNEESAQVGQTPNYFVDPDSKIVLSQNCRSVLLKHFKHIEGCTGTSGNTQELKECQEVFGIEHVLKLPPHEQIRTQFLPTAYANDFDAQVDAIVAVIQNNAPIQPMLVTCKDDIEVKRLYRLVQEKIQSLPMPISGLTLIRDTNDSGKSEADIVPLAGGIGCVVFSSRMGRGTDIKPESKEGLFVLRTYLASARVTKQELGRQGRNGRRGVCQTIINVDELNAEYSAYEELEGGKEALKKLLDYETKHLDAKLEKHQNKGSNKFDAFADENNALKREAYLKSRVCIQFRHQLQQKQNVKLRRYEAMIAWMSMAMETTLRASDTLQGEGREWCKKLQSDWKVQRELIDGLWQKHLTSQKDGGHEAQKQQWLDFVGQVGMAWKQLVDSARVCADPQVKEWAMIHSETTLLHEYQKHLIHAHDAHLEQRPPKKFKSVPHMSQFINFHQQWMEHAVSCRKTCLGRAEQNSRSSLQYEFDEHDLRGLNELFLQLRRMRQGYLSVLHDKDEQEAHTIFTSLFNQISAALVSDLFFMIPSRRAGRILFQWMDKANVLLDGLSDEFDDGEIAQRLYPLNVLTQVLTASSQWLDEQRLNSFEVTAPTRYANLLDLLTQMTFTVSGESWQKLFDESDSRIQHFLEHIGHSLVNEYWSELHDEQFLQRIRQFLVLPADRLGSAHNIELLVKAFPTQDGVKALLNLIRKAELTSAHVQAFHDYVDAHAAVLVTDEYSAVLPVILDLTLGERRPVVNELPEPDMFMHLSVDDKTSAFCIAFNALPKEEQVQFNHGFWTFLSQRRPLTHEEITQFYQFIQKECTMDEALALLQLPPYLSLAHIQQQMNTAIATEQEGAVVTHIQELTAAGHNLNQWMASQGYIDNAAVYSASLQRSANRWQNLFERLPSAKSECLLAMLNEQHIPGDLPELLFTQLEQLITDSALPLDRDVWREYGQELMILLTMPVSWRDALSPCLSTLPNQDEQQQVARSFFLQEVADSLQESDSLPELFQSFPLNYYKSWEQGFYERGAHASLMGLYHRGITLGSSDQRTLIIAQSLEQLLEHDDERAQEQWIDAVHETTLWLKKFCELPADWYQSLSNVLKDMSLTDDAAVQAFPSFFDTLIGSMPAHGTSNTSTIAPLLLAYWMDTVDQEQQLRIDGMHSVLNLAARSSLVEWGLEISNAYLSRNEKPLTARFMLLRHQEQLLDVFSTIPDSWKPLLQEDTKAALDSEDVALIQKRHMFLRVLSKTLPESLSGSSQLAQSTLDLVWNKMINEPLPAEETSLKSIIQDSLDMLQYLSDKSVTPAKEEFFAEQYKQYLSKDERDQITLLKRFIALVPNEWPKECYQALWQGVTEHILNFDDYDAPRSLHRAIYLIREGLMKANAAQLQASWFSSVEQRTPRTELMRGLHYGYLSLGTKNDNSCWHYFTSMIRQGLSYVPKHFGERYHRSAMEGLGRISSVLQELRDITKIPGLDEKVALSEQKGNGAMPDYNAAFSTFKRSYDNAWWKNSDRRRQANELFAGINRINQGLSREEYYMAVMQRIVATQQDIIDSDQKSFIQRNKKGYSRLYDVSTKMLVEVASDYLSDNHTDLSAKEDRAAALQTLLSDSLNAHHRVRQQYGLFRDEKTQQHPALRYLDDAIAALRKGPSLGANEE